MEIAHRVSFSQQMTTTCTFRKISIYLSFINVFISIDNLAKQGHFRDLNSDATYLSSF